MEGVAETVPARGQVDSDKVKISPRGYSSGGPSKVSEYTKVQVRGCVGQVLIDHHAAPAPADPGSGLGPRTQNPPRWGLRTALRALPFLGCKARLQGRVAQVDGAPLSPWYGPTKAVPGAGLNCCHGRTARSGPTVAARDRPQHLSAPGLSRPTSCGAGTGPLPAPPTQRPLCQRSPRRRTRLPCWGSAPWRRTRQHHRW